MCSVHQRVEVLKQVRQYTRILVIRRKERVDWLGVTFRVDNGVRTEEGTGGRKHEVDLGVSTNVLCEFPVISDNTEMKPKRLIILKDSRKCPV